MITLTCVECGKKFDSFVPSDTICRACIGGKSSAVGIAWSEKLEPLGNPFDVGPFGTSDPTRYTPSVEEILGFQVKLLASRCDQLLVRCEELEQQILRLTRQV